jgi:hypothetical protein
MNASARQGAVTYTIPMKPSRALSRTTMKGMVQDAYGPPDVLSVRDIAHSSPTSTKQTFAASIVVGSANRSGDVPSWSASIVSLARSPRVA